MSIQIPDEKTKAKIELTNFFNKKPETDLLTASPTPVLDILKDSKTAQDILAKLNVCLDNISKNKLDNGYEDSNYLLQDAESLVANFKKLREAMSDGSIEQEELDSFKTRIATKAFGEDLASLQEKNSVKLKDLEKSEFNRYCTSAITQIKQVATESASLTLPKVPGTKF